MEKKREVVNNKEKPISYSYYVINSICCVILVYIGIFTRYTTDYSTHTASMAKLSISPLLNPLNWIDFFSKNGYPLWHITAKCIMRILNCPADYAAGICSGIWSVITYIGILIFIKYFFKNIIINDNVIAILSFVLLIIGPVWFPWKNEYIIFGNGGPNVWHNATNICGRAVGLYAFYFSMKLIDKIVDSEYKYTITLKESVGLICIYILSLLAKPSFAQTFVPAFGILLVYYLVKSCGKFRKNFMIYLVIAGIALSKLFLQFMHYFSVKSGDEGIYTKKSGEGVVFIIPSLSEFSSFFSKQWLILLFPIIIFVIMCVKKKLDRYWMITILMLLFSMIEVMTLKGAVAGEMGWGYYIALFFVFLISIRDYILLFFSKQSILDIRSQKILFVISTVVLIEHFCVGLYYLYELIICKMLRF